MATVSLLGTFSSDTKQDKRNTGQQNRQLKITHIPTFQDKVDGKINKTSIVRSQRKERLSRGGRSDVVGQFVSQVAPATENVL